MTSPRPVLAALVAALASACTHGPPPLRATRLDVEHTGHGVRPYVRATVAGEPVRLLLDTGAPHSLLSARLAKARRLPLRTRAADLYVVDAHGTLSRLGVLPDVPILFDGEASPTALDFLMNPASGPDDGILAPQELLRRGWAMTIDLDREELRFDPEPVALERLAARGPRLEVAFRSCPEEGLFNTVHRVIQATVNGVPARMLIDTGAMRTTLARNNPALPSMRAAVGRQGTTGAMVSTGQGLLVDDVAVAFAGASYVVPALVLPASQNCWEGLLGADVLRHCAMVWGWSSLWLACRPPGVPGEGTGQPPP